MCIHTIQRFGVSKMFLKKILILKRLHLFDQKFSILQYILNKRTVFYFNIL